MQKKDLKIAKIDLKVPTIAQPKIQSQQTTFSQKLTKRPPPTSILEQIGVKLAQNSKSKDHSKPQKKRDRFH